MSPHPATPWHTHGRSYVSPYLVRARDVHVPPQLTVESHFGMATGLLGYVVYEDPSPLRYAELIWLSCRVSARTADGRTVRGFYVDKMYVDLEASKRAGQDLWGLPKQLATFDERDGRVHVATEDGAELTLEIGARGPSLTASSSVVTLQVRGDEVIRFTGDTTRAKTSAGFVRVISHSGTASFHGFDGAQRLPGAGVALLPFETMMRAPEILRVR